MELFKLISLWGAVAIIWLVAIVACIGFFAMIISIRKEPESEYSKEVRQKKESKEFLKRLTDVKDKTLQEIDSAIVYLDDEKAAHERYIRALDRKRKTLEKHLKEPLMPAEDNVYDDCFLYGPEMKLDDDTHQKKMN